MNKELQNLVWSILPKEYKEEVKKKCEKYSIYDKSILYSIFGKHNLKCSISQGNAIGLYSINDELISVYANAIQASVSIGISPYRVRKICKGISNPNGDYTLRYLAKKK